MQRELQHRIHLSGHVRGAALVDLGGCRGYGESSADLLVQSITSTGLSNIAQIPGGQKRRVNRCAIPKRSVFISSCTGTHPGVRGLVPKHSGELALWTPAVRPSTLE
jgi:hypothetical protein